ncbi:MAG: hypothetical protein DRG78_11310 [Epsilonproteobacteria bacterium]|nr:MAG: hypothetical protein DRG78_11310 [Campylobacterota bacterium]
MKKQTTKQFYTDLLMNKYDESSSFLIEIRDLNHVFWEVCREFSKEILISNASWYWLGYRVDDFAKIIEIDMINKMEKWSEKGSLSKYLNSLEKTIIWLLDRHVNALKNLFDKRYTNSIDFTILVDYEEVVVESKDNNMVSEVILSDFHRYSKFQKVQILKKLWDDNLYDFDFNLEDLEELCEKYSAPPPSSFIKLEKTKKYETEQTESGNSQLVFTF